jgi:hypothetical protein
MALRALESELMILEEGFVVSSSSKSMTSLAVLSQGSSPTFAFLHNSEYKAKVPPGKRMNNNIFNSL